MKEDGGRYRMQREIEAEEAWWTQSAEGDPLNLLMQSTDGIA